MPLNLNGLSYIIVAIFTFFFILSHDGKRNQAVADGVWGMLEYLIMVILASIAWPMFYVWYCRNFI